MACIAGGSRVATRRCEVVASALFWDQYIESQSMIEAIVSAFATLTSYSPAQTSVDLEDQPQSNLQRPAIL